MRRTSMVGLAGFLVGVLAMAALPSMAANGDALLLGEKNTARRITKVKIKNGIVFEATAVGTPAATFNVAFGAPIAVNSSMKVEDLNADEVDGYSANQMRVGWDFDSNDNLPDDQNWSSSIQVVIPQGGGAVAMSGGVGWFNDTGANYEGGCKFQVDGVNVSGSFRADEAEHSESATCTSEALKALPAGTYTVTFTTVGLGSTTGIRLLEGFWYVLVLPN